jgi:hypothetical protein
MYMHIPEYSAGDVDWMGVQQTVNKRSNAEICAMSTGSTSPFPECALFFPECV